MRTGEDERNQDPTIQGRTRPKKNGVEPEALMDRMGAKLWWAETARVSPCCGDALKITNGPVTHNMDLTGAQEDIMPKTKDAYQRPVERFFKPCSCDKAAKYGYEVWRRGTLTFWETVCIGTIEQCLKHSEMFPCILVACRGCGKELLREYRKPQHVHNPRA
jgi:hypothetical protein